MLTYGVPGGPWKVSLDVLSRLAEAEKGNKYILVMVDILSSVTLAEAFKDVIICWHSTPEVILSDNGPEFDNAVLGELSLQSYWY